MAILVYTTILSNVVTTNAIKLVPTAAKAAGLPASSAIALLEALPLGTAASEKVPGVRLEIVEAAGAAYQQAYVVGLRTTALSSLSFGICGIIDESTHSSPLLRAIQSCDLDVALRC